MRRSSWRQETLTERSRPGQGLATVTQQRAATAKSGVWSTGGQQERCARESVLERDQDQSKARRYTAMSTLERAIDRWRVVAVGLSTGAVRPEGAEGHVLCRGTDRMRERARVCCQPEGGRICENALAGARWLQADLGQGWRREVVEEREEDDRQVEPRGGRDGKVETGAKCRWTGHSGSRLSQQNCS
ncbi:hypothetical protein BD289DRAFT_424582 [Coniella lustricola]|uniref:Uncharacterized protein n=1 Tax=Coniella lustricola TaxID=2025994 RepID=A0A2T3AI73_9PEZI|nr:hypothetical protein BD289DRAFT_424582 [Coniella lustricola]